MIKCLEIEIKNFKTTFSMDDKETALLVHYSTLLNYNREAQESELFLQGHYDTTSIDFDDDFLNTIVPYSGKNIVEHRQSFAHVSWHNANSQKIKLGENDYISYAKKIFKWRIRAPIPHGLAKQPRVMPVDTRVVIDVTVKQPNAFLIKVDDYMEVRITKAD